MDITITELVEWSGLREHPDYSTHDYAIPMNSDGTYPHGGDAISIYWKTAGLGMNIVPYTTLAEWALAKLLPDWRNHILDQVNRDKERNALRAFADETYRQSYIIEALIQTIIGKRPLRTILQDRKPEAKEEHYA